ncbi:hypothetical protein [Engelhardtia mirabilis]|uniref:Uncharacterized protein n=1 Tax=Engelhardtia mirabilis TaxID=2528011 RepID=A0A518BLZ9_9BACT|nr:hypothetical protein Pla133_30960 [Planctomycetes bacterium Pla133]QDV02331.1 hypothetical protein Pla86_30950 [Planctomycetes bacterium Pla86]
MAVHDPNPDPPERAAKARAALVIAAVLAVVVELLLALALPEHRGRHELDARVAQVQGARIAPRVVLLSDSVSYDVLWPVPDGVLDLSSNQSVSTAGNAFLVQRLADTLARRGVGGGVERVVYVLSPASFEADLRSERFLELYFTSIFNRPAERHAVSERLGRPELVAELETQARRRWLYPPSYLRRGYLLRPLAEAMRELDRRLRGSGQLPSAAPAATLQRIDKDTALDHLMVSEVTADFLPLLAEAAGRLGARVEVRLAPVPPTTRAAWQANGALPDLERELEALCAPVDGLTYGGPIPYEPPGDRAFYDGSHLHPVARRAYGEALAAELGDG